MKSTSNRTLPAGFAPALALLGGAPWFDWRQIGRRQKTAEWVAHTHEVPANSNRLLVRVEDSGRDVELTLAAPAEHKLVNEAAVVRQGDEPLSHPRSKRVHLAARSSRCPSTTLRDS